MLLIEIASTSYTITENGLVVISLTVLIRQTKQFTSITVVISMGLNGKYGVPMSVLYERTIQRKKYLEERGYKGDRYLGMLI